MELLFEQNIVARVLLTFLSIGLCLGPMIADFNKTHATNPLWPGHARFHVVWQVLNNSSNALVLLFLVWVPLVQYDLQLILVCVFIGLSLISFFATLLGRNVFDGTLTDPNGIPPFRFKLPGKTWEVDTNLFNFGVLSILLPIAALNIVQL